MNVIFLFCLFLAPAYVMALPEENCDFWQQKANLYMNWRQQEIPISEAIKDTAGNRSRGLLLRAYNEPVATELEAKYQKVKQFAEQVHTECLLETEAGK